MRDFFDDVTWEDWAFAGAMAEEMCEEEKMRRRLEREIEEEEEPCCCNDDDPYP